VDPSGDPVSERAWRCRDVRLDVYRRTHVMGILNVTPDSFFDGGRFADPEAALERGLEMVADGADVVDVGGESTRPGAEPVSADEEAARVLPVIEALAGKLSVPISIDTTKAGVAQAALDAGAVIVNDVSALRADVAMAGVVARSGAGVVLMHMLGEPRTMQKDPRYRDVVADVSRALAGWAGDAEAAGIEHDRIVVDPGIGFGKTLEHNLLLLRHIDALGALEYPVLVGPSRKSFMGLALGLPAEERLEATAGAVAWCVAQGAHLVRVHDVKEMVRVVRMVEAIRDAGGAGRPGPPRTTAEGGDRIVVRGLTVFGYHGVRPREREEGQHFVVDLEAYLDLRPGSASDRLGETLDYSELARRAAGIVAGERYDLIEALAERLASMVLEHPAVRRTVIRVAKPEALKGLDVGEVFVEIERER
jgi:dihydropteroate synthase